MKRYYLGIGILCCLIGLSSCSKDHFIEDKGGVYGTYYSVVYESQVDYGSSFDSIFEKINNAVSSYLPGSEVSAFNNNGLLKHPSPIFYEQLKSADYYNRVTNGAFEPTLKTLIDVWGFGLKKRENIDSTRIDSLLKFVSFQKNISFNREAVKANKQGVTLSLTALGEGYTLNKIAAFLDKKGIKNYKVELGGELKCHGKNPEGEIWKIGIENPYYDSDNSQNELMGILKLNNSSLSTSGSYRKFYIDKNGRKRPHIIDPATGYPVTHNLLSVSIKCKDAEKADAFATACMVMGAEKAQKFISKNDEIEGFLIFENAEKKLKTWTSPGFFSA
ncbi:MAG: FAD:protein FMN transferase [Gillisia sp.]